MKTLKTHFALTSVIAMLVLTVSIHAQAESIIGKKAKQSTAVGGGDTGGGGPGYAESSPVQLDAKVVENAVEIVTGLLPGIFRSIDNMYFYQYSQNANGEWIKETEHENENYKRINMILSQKLYRVPEYKLDIFARLKNIKFKVQENACLDKNKAPVAASIYNVGANEVCISTKMILSHPKISIDNIFVEMIGLCVHEMLHKSGIESEAFVRSIQYQVVYHYRPPYKTWNWPPWDNFLKFPEQIASSYHTKVGHMLKAIDHIQEANGAFADRCSEIQFIQREVSEMSVSLEETMKTFMYPLYQYDASVFRAAHASAFALSAYCVTPKGVERAKNRYSFGENPVLGIVAEMKPNEIRKDLSAQYYQFPLYKINFNDVASMNKQLLVLEEALKKIKFGLEAELGGGK